MSLERFTRRELVTASPEQSAQEVADLMRSHHVGAVVVVEGGLPAGIVTDRDLVLRVLADGRPPTTAVSSAMTRDLVVARPQDSLDHAFFQMRQHGIRRLPIVGDDGALVGLVAIDDLIVLLGGELSSLVETVVENRGP